jgi:hypothetical protein
MISAMIKRIRNTAAHTRPMMSLELDFPAGPGLLNLPFLLMFDFSLWESKRWMLPPTAYMNQ